MRTIWMNGTFVPESEARISIYDEALMFGTMVFEMMRTFNKQTFMLWEHLDRLYASADRLEIPMPYTKKLLYGIHENTILHNRKEFGENDEVRTLINVSRGYLPIYKEMGRQGTNVIAAAFPLKFIINPKCYDGVRAVIPSQRAIPQHLLDPKLKTRSRQHYQVANLEVKRQDPDAWPILLDPDGFVAESTGSNIFIIKCNRFELITPEPRNILRGVSRAYVMDLARKLKMAVIEKNITEYDLYEAQEIFFTCTPYCIVPCISVNGRPVGDGKPGRKTLYLTTKWAEDVGSDFVGKARCLDS